MTTVYTTVKEAFTHTYGHGGSVTVPAGARTQLSLHGTDHRWVDPAAFPAGSLERHDAEHYGIRVPLSNRDQWEPA